MYQCPECGGNIKYDIVSGQMLCGYCATQIDPYSLDTGKDAVEESYFNTTIYTCPQCAGELVCEDTEAAVFCPYCGGSTILDGRMNRARRPSGIIPFSKTKEDCKKAYRKYMKWAIYAPSDIKSEKYIDGFRSIYVPYWSYNVQSDDAFCWIGTKKSIKKSCIYLDSYNVRGHMIVEYRGHHDASAGFSDEVCERIEPFCLEEKKEFTPAYISGFYADIPDVDVSVYAKQAKEMAKKDILKLFRLSKHSKSLNIGKAPVDNILKVQTPEVFLFPVWFMSHRKGNNVLYATVNGQTGKVAADIPIDVKKFFLGVLLLSIPICLLFMLLFSYQTVKPIMLLVIMVTVALFFFGIYAEELKALKVKTENLDEPERVETSLRQEEREFEEKLREKERRKKQEEKIISRVAGSILLLLGAPIILVLVMNNPAWFGLIFAFVGFLLVLMVHKKMKDVNLKKKKRNYWLVFASVLISSIVLIWNPAMEAVFYIMTGIVVLGVGIGFSDLLFYHNTLAMREIPQFTRKGGDDNA